MFASTYSFETYGLVATLVNFKNTGTAKKAKFVKTPKENPLKFIKGTYGVQVSFADFDKNGDYDLLATDLYTETFYINTGTAATPQFSANSRQIFTAFPFYAEIVAVYDYSKDGRADVFNSEPYFKPGSIAYDRNVTAKGATRFKFVQDSVNAPAMPSGFVTFGFADLNNDGVAEAFTEDGHYAVALAASAAKEAISVTPVSDAVSVKAYPNPFTGSFVINLGSIASSNAVIKIADLQGRIVSTVKANSQTVQLGSNLPKGVYFVQVIQDAKVVFTHKVIKQ